MLAFAQSCGVAAARRAPYALLEFLVRNAGQTVSRAAILEQVWKFDLDTMTNVVDVYINYLRRKVDFGFDRHFIRTIRRVAIRLAKAPGTARLRLPVRKVQIYLKLFMINSLQYY